MGEGRRAVSRVGRVVHASLKWPIYWGTLALVGGTVAYMMVMELYGYPTKRLLANSPLVDLLGPDVAALLLAVGIGTFVVDCAPAREGDDPEAPKSAQRDEAATTQHRPVAGDPGVYHPDEGPAAFPATTGRTPSGAPADVSAPASESPDSGPAAETKSSGDGEDTATPTGTTETREKTGSRALFGIFALYLLVLGA